MKKKDFSSYPVAEVIADVRNALALHKRAVLSAPTGSGKSTVLPLALLDEDFLALMEKNMEDIGDFQN